MNSNIKVFMVKFFIMVGKLSDFVENNYKIWMVLFSNFLLYRGYYWGRSFLICLRLYGLDINL